MNRTTSRRPPLALLGAAVVGVVVLAVPLIYLLVRVLGAGDSAWAALWRTRTLDTVMTSVLLVLLVAVGALVLAAPTAWLLSRTDVPLSRTFLVLTALPLAVPSYVAAYAWLALFPGMNGIWAASAVMALCTFPYVSIPLVAVLRSMDAGPEQVARSLGLSRAAVLRRVVAPMAWPAAGAGLLLVALYTLAEFGTVSIFRVDAFTRVIYASYRASFDRTAAAVLAVLLVILALVLVLLEARARGRAARWRIGPGVGRPADVMRLSSGGRVLALAWLSLVVFVSLVVPIGSIVQQLISSQRRQFDPGVFLGALSGSVSASTLGAIVALLIALPIGVLAARYAGRGVRFVEGAAFLSQGLPGVVVGLSLVFLTLALLPAVYQTLATVAFAYAVLFAPKAIGATRTSVAAVPPDLESVARSLGRGPIGAWWSTTGRLAWPGVAAGGLLVLLTAMKELPATLMLRPTGFETLATRLWSRMEAEAFGAAAPYALALIAVAAVPAWLVSRWLGSQAPGIGEDGGVSTIDGADRSPSSAKVPA